METVLDITALALALLVAASLALLAWTLGLTAVRRARRGRQGIATRRVAVARAELRLRETAPTSRERLRSLADRARLDQRKEA